jgi:hypothetical protein
MTEKSTRKSDHDLLLRDYRPVPRLVVKSTPTTTSVQFSVGGGSTAR